MKVFIVHAWNESPTSCWYPWLKQELEARGMEVQVPGMPNPAAPNIETWVSKLRELVPEPNEQIYFVGHSVGCQTILRYLEKLPDEQKTGGAIFVAPWTRLTGLSGASQQIAKPWIETSINWQAAKTRCPRFFALFSDNDEWVSLSERTIFKDKLNAQTEVIANAGHFDKMTELPEVLELVERL